MPIFNKDGTVYKIKGSAPLVDKKEKPSWEFNKVILHNLDFSFSNEEITVPVIEQTEVIKEPILIPVQNQKLITQEPVLETKPIKNSFSVHCLPAEIKIYKDILYNQEHKTISYGFKFKFNASLIEKTDLNLILKTTNKDIKIGSILFPQTGHARWWKIKDTEKNKIGLNLYCEPSDYQPSF